MSSTHLPLMHLNLRVADVERSAEFYGRWFGFTGPRRTYSDGTVFLCNDDGFDLGLHPGTPPHPLAPTVHFGFRGASPAAVRDLRAALQDAGVVLVETFDEDDYVGCKCLDPDGYVIEVYWEPLPAGGS